MPLELDLRRDGAVTIGVAMIAAAVHSSILRLYWMYDDPFHIHFLLTHPLRFLIVPSLWRELPFRMYTPLQFASYAFDLHMFGINARAWYAHQLVSLSVACAVLFLTLRLWWSRLLATLGTIAFTTNPHIVGWAGLLMARHYIEGFIFTCAAAAMFTLYLRRRGLLLLVAATLLYATAVLFKEVFVLLPLGLLLLPEGSARDRIRACLPIGVVTLCYAVVRYSMLETWFGGYGWSVPPDARILFYAAAPLRILHAAFAPALLWIPVIAASAFIGARRPSMIACLLVAVAAVVLPIVPVSTELEARYLVLPCFIGSLAFYAATIWLTPANRAIVLTAATVWLIVASFFGNRPVLTSLRRQSAETRFFMQLGPRDVLAQPVIPPATIAELTWVKSYLGGVSGTTWFYDDIYACGHAMNALNVWKHAGSRFVIAGSPFRSGLPCAADQHPLFVNMSRGGDSIFWDLGPYQRGMYSIVLGEGVQSFAIPAHWGFHVGEQAPLTFRIRYDSLDGWRSYSPVLRFESGKQRLAWRRP